MQAICEHEAVLVPMMEIRPIDRDKLLDAILGAARFHQPQNVIGASKPRA